MQYDEDRGRSDRRAIGTDFRAFELFHELDSRKAPQRSRKCAPTLSSAVRSRLLSKEDVEQTLAIMKRCRLEACKSLSEVDKAVPRGEIEHT